MNPFLKIKAMISPMDEWEPEAVSIHRGSLIEWIIKKQIL
jgi:hypothetical protein